MMTDAEKKETKRDRLINTNISKQPGVSKEVVKKIAKSRSKSRSKSRGKSRGKDKNVGYK
jgi:hypothetical protein